MNKTRKRPESVYIRQVEDWTECAQTHTETDRETDKSENSISASFTRSLGGMATTERTTNENY